MGKLKKILKKSKEIVDKAKVKKKYNRNIFGGKKMKESEKAHLVALGLIAPPLTYSASSMLMDQDARGKAGRERRKLIEEEEERKKRNKAARKKREEAEKNKRESKKTKPKKMKAGGIALRGYGKAFLKGKK